MLTFPVLMNALYPSHMPFVTQRMSCNPCSAFMVPSHLCAARAVQRSGHGGFAVPAACAQRAVLVCSTPGRLPKLNCITLRGIR
jgi:hypothetical protein